MELVTVVFLGRSTRVDRAFAAKLAKVEQALRKQSAANGILSVGGYREHGGWHSKGRAVDLNYNRNGYAVCRTRTARGLVYGGESAGAKIRGARKAFMDACDRACLAFDGLPADLSARRTGETTGDVWDRWHRASEAVKAYLAPYYPAVDALDIGEDDILSGVRPESIPPQVRDDYRALRVPLVIGAPVEHPRTTRNPATGLMDIPRAVAVAMCDVGGLRWGACDFGASSSGDIMHFDDANRIASGA